jgi:hypothetical protein
MFKVKLRVINPYDNGTGTVIGTGTVTGTVTGTDLKAVFYVHILCGGMKRGLLVGDVGKNQPGKSELLK